MHADFRKAVLVHSRVIPLLVEIDCNYSGGMSFWYFFKILILFYSILVIKYSCQFLKSCACPFSSYVVYTIFSMNSAY
jgi:hypothetical protein